MRTTLGRSARATAENADDSTRASLGACILGVTGPAPPAPARGAVGAASSAVGDGSAGEEDAGAEARRSRSQPSTATVITRAAAVAFMEGLLSGGSSPRATPCRGQ